MSNALYQFTMRGDNLQDLTTYAPQMLQELRNIPIIADVNSDQQNRGLQSMVQYDRDTAARFGISPQLIDNTLYDAFGQRQVSTMYTALNQYHVVMEAAPQYWQDPQILQRDLRAARRRTAGSAERLRAASRPTTAPLAVNHQGLFPAVTISFNLQPGVALGDAVDAIMRDGRQDRPAAHHPDRLRGHGAGLSGFARATSRADRRRAGGGLHRARNAVRELHPSRSRFFPRCPRRAWARCWR